MNKPEKKKKKKYEKPQLVPLDKLTESLGACVAGGWGCTGTCGTGGAASGNCGQGGTPGS
jgi:hypothetical protein